MVFRRPELEKDNPIASQPYMGPRRRRALAHAMSVEASAEMGEMKEAFQALTDAASRFVKGLPKSRTPAKNLAMLRDAIGQAERVLSAEARSA
jgi:hypothetical protein